MRTIDLREYERSAPIALSVRERDAIASADLSIAIAPAAGQRDAYILRPSSTVGSIELEGLSIQIRPKLPIQRVLYLALQAINRVDFREQPFGFTEAEDPIEVLTPAFIRAAQRAFARGLLHGYRSAAETLTTVRGRVDFAEQLRRRYDLPLPVAVQYDEFTEDVLANRLVRAAGARLGALHTMRAMGMADTGWRRGLGRIDAALANVRLLPFSARELPVVEFDRLNAHYREVVELSRLILHHTSIDQRRGGVRASGLLMDMNVVFQEFVTRALRQALGLSERSFRSDAGRAAGALDEAGTIALRPDFAWWQGGVCRFAGDAKYKVAEDGRGANADLYQALAYATALNLPGALLVYAEGAEAAHRVRFAGKRLEVGTVALDGTIAQLQASIDALAAQIQRMRADAQEAARVLQP